MSAGLSSSQMAFSQVRLLHATRGSRQLKRGAPPTFFPRPGVRLVAELAAWRTAGLSIREVAAAELGVGEEDYSMWEMRSAYDDSFLVDALSWG